MQNDFNLASVLATLKNNNLRQLASLLCKAAAQGNIEAAKQIIAAGALVSAPNTCCRTALQFATDCGHAAITQLLIDNNADVDAANENGNTPPHWARASASVELAGMRISKTAMLHAKNIQAAALLSIPREDGYTALHLAAIRGHVEIAQLLIDNGALLDAVDRLGDTPLHRSVFHCHTGIMELLVRRGAKLDIQDDCGNTPLHHAVYAGNFKATQLLVESGAALDAMNGGHHTPLDLAISYGHTEIVRSLLDKGASTAPRADYVTALHKAAYFGHTEIARLLLYKGATVDALSKGGVTPLALATTQRHSEIVLLLGGNPKRPTRIGRLLHALGLD